MDSYLILFFVSFSASLALTPLIRWLALRIGAVDLPGDRKIHSSPLPRLGGVSVVLSMVMAGLVAAGLEQTASMIQEGIGTWLPVLLGGTIVFLIGLWDDLHPVPAWVKLMFQAAAAGVAIWFGIRIDRVSLLGGGTIDLGLLALPITFLWIIGVTNAFNLIDGLDGLASGLAAIAAGTCASIFLLRGEVDDAMLLIVLLGALAGFIKYNFNPAKVFLGDSGSLVIGYVLALSAITGSQKGATALAVVVPLLVFGLPIIDTLLSMIRRFVGGLKLIKERKAALKDSLRHIAVMFQPDQGHIHHRLIMLGFSHKNAVLALYAFSLGLSLLALLSVMAEFRNAGIILIAVGLATYIGIHKLGYKELSFLETGTLLRWYEQFRFNRLFAVAFIDILLIAAAYWGAFALKYEAPAREELKSWYLLAFPSVLLVQLSVFYVSGLYKGVWRALVVADLLRKAATVLTAVVLSYVLVSVSVPLSGVPAFFCIDLLMLGTLVLGARSMYRILDHARHQQSPRSGTALIYGAGRGGELLLQELFQNSTLGLRPIGFIDDLPGLKGRVINRIPVLGTSHDLPSILRAVSVTSVIISTEKIVGDHLNNIFAICRQHGVSVLQGRMQVMSIQESVGQMDSEAQESVTAILSSKEDVSESSVGSVECEIRPETSPDFSHAKELSA